MYVDIRNKFIPRAPKSSREMIRLIPQGKQIHLTERIFPYHETDEKANVMSFFR